MILLLEEINRVRPFSHENACAEMKLKPWLKIINNATQGGLLRSTENNARQSETVNVSKLRKCMIAKKNIAF